MTSYGGCCGATAYGSYYGMGWQPMALQPSSCTCGTPIVESVTSPAVVVPASPESPMLAPQPQPSVKVAPPAAMPAEAATPPAPAAQPYLTPPVPAKAAEPKKADAPVKPAEPKKADAPAKKVSWTGRGLRVWTDTTGEHQVMARFVETVHNGSVVRLLRPNGSYVRIAFNLLSADDQKYVLTQNAKVAAAW